MKRLMRYFAGRNRRRKAAFVEAFVRRHAISSVLFVGVGQGWEPHDLIVESAAARSVSLAVGCDLHERTNIPWPYVRASGLALPFADGSFDLVLSNAVIEHVGSEGDQAAFVHEHRRVGRHWIITTPNRWFPIESHTGVFMLHWLPGWRRRKAAKFTRLLGRSEFRRLLPVGSDLRAGSLSPTFIGHGSGTSDRDRTT